MVDKEEKEFRDKLERELGEGLYEIMLDGYIALVGKLGYIEWKVREFRLNRIIINNLK